MGNSRTLLWVSALATAALLMPGRGVGFAQSSSGQTGATPDSANLTAPNSSRQVLDHLNAVIRWYRQWDEAGAYLKPPGDELYVQNGQAVAGEVLRLDFKSALAQSALIANATAKRSSPAGASQNLINAQSIPEKQQQVASQIDSLKTELNSLSRRIALAPAKERPALIAQRNLLQGQIQLAQAMQDNLQKLTSFMANAEIANGRATELSGKILALQRTVPAVPLSDYSKTAGAGVRQGASVKAAPPNSATDSATTVSNNDGLIGQITQMFRLLGTLRSVHQLSDRGASLQNLTQQLRAPLLADLRATLQQGQIAISVPPPSEKTPQSSPGAHSLSVPSAAQGSAVQSAPAQTAPDQAQMAALIHRFRLLSDATLPLSQELILIDQSQSDLAQLQSSVEHQYAAILRSVLLRVAAILFSLGLIWLFSELWRRATFRYIHDARRRRQFLVLRRVITGFCMFVVILLGFVSEFSSLATYAGLITAGIAVALQGVILSIAAYFFLVGRYGVRVGDRVTVVYSGSANVSGEVLDIGLIRFSLMELAGSGIDMQPTGRIVVFTNSVLFQTTPLFKQLPGTEYTWRELAFPLHPDTDPQLAEKAMLSAVESIYQSFGPLLEKQLLAIERSMGLHMEVPKPYTRVRFASSGLEAVLRYPIPMREAAAQDDRMVMIATEILRQNPAIRLKDGAMPELRSAIKT